MNNDIENLLIQKIQKGDKAAFDTLFRKYYSALVNYANKITSDAEVAEEVVQEVFVSIWTHKEKLHIEKSLVQYLFTSVKYRAYSLFRHETTRAAYEQEYAEKQAETAGDAHSEKLTDYEISCLVSDALLQLPEKCREIFILKREEGLSLKEIAEHLGISVKTVENQMTIAFKKLREILAPALKSRFLLLVVLFYLFK